LMGKGDLAIRIADWFLQSEKYNLIAVVPVIPEPVWTQSLANWGRESGVPVIMSGHYRDLPQLTQDGKCIDLAVSVFYDKIIKAWFIDKCEKIINLHNGPLPRYRGVSPINWALKNEECEHGITIHEITPGIDDGPVIGQLKYSIYPEFDEVIDVYRRSLEYGWALFQQTVPIIDKITPRQQDHSKATYYSKLDNPRLGDRLSFERPAAARQVEEREAVSVIMGKN
jgi:methionyl-tRNA formyltransferase